MRGNAREKHLGREEETGAEESCDKRPAAWMETTRMSSLFFDAVSI